MIFRKFKRKMKILCFRIRNLNKSELKIIFKLKFGFILKIYRNF